MLCIRDDCGEGTDYLESMLGNGKQPNNTHINIKVNMTVNHMIDMIEGAVKAFNQKQLVMESV